MGERQQPVAAAVQRSDDLLGAHVPGWQATRRVRPQHGHLDAGMPAQPGERPDHRAVLEGGREHAVSRLQEAVQEQVQRLGGARRERHPSRRLAA